MLRRNHQQNLAGVVLLGMPACLESHAEAAGQRARRPRRLIRNLARSRLEPEHRHHVFILVEAALDVQRLPRTALLPFGEAGRELAWCAERRSLDIARPRAADVAQHQFQRAPDRRVRARAVAERHHAHVHLEAMPNRTVHHDHRRRAPGRGHDAVDVELVGADRFERRDHDRQILGLASRHHGVDRDFLDRHRRQVRRHDRDDVARIAPRPRQHPHHALGRRRHHGQTVGQPALEHEFEYVFGVAQLDSARGQLVAARIRLEPLRDSRLDRLGTAPGPRLGI